MKLVFYILLSASFIWANQDNQVAPVVTPVPPPATPSAQPSPPPPPPKPVVKAPDFHTEVRAVLESTCISCHGANDQKGGLRLDTLAFAKEGGDSGPAIVPGNKIESILLERIHLPADDDEIMPPKNGPLSAQQKDILDRWIETGANWPKGIQLKEITERELVLRTKARNKQFVSLAAYPSGHNSYDQGRF